MLEAFAFLGAWWFWICLVGFFVLLGCEAFENRIVSFITIVTGVLLLQWLGDVNIFGYITSNPLECIGWVAGYFLVGTLYAPLKWYFFVLDKADKYNDKWEGFCQKHVLDPSIKIVSDPNVVREWDRVSSYDKHEYPPRAAKNKPRIMGWIGYWPISVIWWIVDDFVRRVTRAIYNVISDTLQSISDRVFKDKLVVVDIPDSEKKRPKGCADF